MVMSVATFCCTTGMAATSLPVDFTVVGKAPAINSLAQRGLSCETRSLSIPQDSFKRSSISESATSNFVMPSQIKLNSHETVTHIRSPQLPDVESTRRLTDNANGQSNLQSKDDVLLNTDPVNDNQFEGQRHRKKHKSKRRSSKLTAHPSQISDVTDAELSAITDTIQTSSLTLAKSLTNYAYTCLPHGNAPKTTQRPHSTLPKHVLPLTLKTGNSFTNILPSLRRSTRSSQWNDGKSKEDLKQRKLSKVYLSEKQSQNMKDLGLEFPCAPPATPTPEQLMHVEYIPSLKDIRAQREVKIRLEVLEKFAQKKHERIQAEKIKKDKQNEKGQIRLRKHRQRLEVYELNKAMRELENSNFEQFSKNLA